MTIAFIATAANKEAPHRERNLNRIKHFTIRLFSKFVPALATFAFGMPAANSWALPFLAGAKLLRALGVKGDEPVLLNASKQFSGHCLALTLLGSYLTDAYNGDIRRRKEVSVHLAHDVRQGVHVRKVMESYQIWFGEGPELSVLRMLGLFDRPAEGKALETLLKPPAIEGLTESLIDLNPTARRTIVARLRRARLLAEEDAHNRGSLDTHPLVREYFGEQLRS